MKTEARQLVTGEEGAALDFLNLQPLKNVTLIGFIHDRGLESPAHRGAFYGCFRAGRFIGLALIGHHVVLCGSHDAAPAFAELARLHHRDEPRMVIGEETAVKIFCDRLTQPPCQLNLHRTESHLLCALTEPQGELREVPALRLARPDEVDEVAQIHARAYLDQAGVDPIKQDPLGFRQRTLDRIQQGRVWVARDRQGISFKADAVSETDRAVYLEGVWTRPDVRGTGLGSAALGGVCQRLLRRYQTICLMVDAEARHTISFYQRVGFAPLASFSVVRYLPSRN